MVRGSGGEDDPKFLDAHEKMAKVPAKKIIAPKSMIGSNDDP